MDDKYYKHKSCCNCKHSKMDKDNAYKGILGIEYDVKCKKHVYVLYMHEDTINKFKPGSRYVCEEHCGGFSFSYIKVIKGFILYHLRKVRSNVNI